MFLYLLTAFVYLQIGFHFGKAGANVWRRRDNHSTRSFLIFPIRHSASRVGKMTSALGQSVHDEECMAFRTLMTFTWPIAMVMNAVAIAFLGPGWIATRGKRLEAAWAARLAAFEEENRLADAGIARAEAGDDWGDDVRTRIMPIHRVCVIADDGVLIDQDAIDCMSSTPRRRRHND